MLSEDMVELDEVLEELLTVPAWAVYLETEVDQLEDLVPEYVGAENGCILSVALAHLVIS